MSFFRLLLFDKLHEKSTWSNWQFVELSFTRHSSDPFHFFHFLIQSYELFYHFNHSITMTTNCFLIPRELNYFDHQTFSSIIQLRNWNIWADTDAIHTQILKIDNFRDASRAYLEIRIKNLFGEDKIKNEINNNLNSYLINEEKIHTELIDSRQCFPHRSHKNQIIWNNNIRRKCFSILLQRYNLWNRIIWIHMYSRYQLRKS